MRVSRCFYCGTEVEYSGETKIITDSNIHEFEFWECHSCNRRYLVESMNEEEIIEDFVYV